MTDIDPTLADTPAEKLLVEWFQQWWERDDMPSKMSAALHVRTGMYFKLKEHHGDLDLALQPADHFDDEYEPGHMCLAQLRTWPQPTSEDGVVIIACECTWQAPTRREHFNRSMRLHWLAKRIEREALHEPAKFEG